MPVPDFQSLMLPVLVHASNGEVRIGDVIEKLANDLKLSQEDLAELNQSGQTTFYNRVNWAKSYLKQAGLVEPTKRAHFQITERGKEVLKSGIERIDLGFLKRIPEFIAFQSRTRQTDEGEISAEMLPYAAIDERQTPDDLMRITHSAINATLGSDILERLRLSSPSFFERVVVRLLLAMGYGGSFVEAGRAIVSGRPGDNGIDGVIDQDTLGLDRVYIQAKRYAEDVTVGAGDIRDFFGSLDMHKANKGLFVTTSSFTKSAVDTVEKLGKRIVLIDGQALAQFMVRFNVGCRVEEVFELKKIDEEFFD